MVVLVFDAYSFIQVFLCVWLSSRDIGHVQRLSCALPDVPSFVFFLRRYPLNCAIHIIVRPF